MDNFSKRLDNLFNIPAEEELETNTDIISYNNQDNTEFLNQELSTVLDHDLKVDYDKSRDNINSLIEKGTDAVDNMLAIAKASEKSRDFEVTGELIKTVVDATKELIALQKQMRDITGKKATTNNIKNAVFVGSTKDFLQALNTNNDSNVIEGEK